MGTHSTDRSLGSAAGAADLIRMLLSERSPVDREEIVRDVIGHHGELIMTGEDFKLIARYILTVSVATSVDSLDDERAAFESWVTGEFGFDRDDLVRSGDGYQLTGVDSAWDGWQARSAYSQAALEAGEVNARTVSSDA